MTQSTPTFGAIVADRAAVAAALGLEVADLARMGCRCRKCRAAFRFCSCRSATAQAVDRAISDAAAFRRLTATTKLDRAIFMFSTDPAGSTETAYSRMFAPEFGIIEDPATGSASGPLGCYLVHHGVVAGEAAKRMVSLQGAAMGRASRIHISIDGDRREISRVRVGGEAVLVGRGELLV